MSCVGADLVGPIFLSLLSPRNGGPTGVSHADLVGGGGRPPPAPAIFYDAVLVHVGVARTLPVSKIAHILHYIVPSLIFISQIFSSAGDLHCAYPVAEISRVSPSSEYAHYVLGKGERCFR